MASYWAGLVVKLIAWPAGACSSRVTTLRHETFDDAVEGGAIVVAVPSEEDEIVNSDRGFLRVKLNGELATLLHLQCGGVVLVGIDHHLRRCGVLFR